jgi:peptidyl-prolyl cis-trans isomerase SurA
MKKRPVFLRFAAFCAMALALAVLLSPIATPAAAQSAIKVLVNDDPITSYDIQQRARMMRVFTGGKKGSEKEAMDQLIDEKLMMQEAKRRGATLSDQAVDEEFARRAKAVKMTPAQFTQAMRQAGFDTATFKQFIRANLEWASIVRARFRATVDVTDQDVTAALAKKDLTGEQQSALEYMIQQVLFVVPAGSSPAIVDKRMSEANAFRSGFKGCDHSVEQAKSTTGIVVKPQVRKSEDSLPDELRKSLAGMSVGETTKPERIPEGIQVLAVCAKNKIAGQTEASLATRSEITDERGQLLARRYLRDLRADAAIEYR